MRVLRHLEPRGGGDAPLRRRGHVTADASSQGRRPNLLGRPPPTDAVRDPRQGAEAAVARGVVRCRVLARGDARTRTRRAFQDPQRPGNVLCYGVRRKRAPSARDPPPPDRGTPGGANITGRPDLEVSVASAATTSLLGVKHWRTFHERVGDALMTHVLVHGSVFVPSALMRSNSDPGRHGSHLQLCGAPVSGGGRISRGGDGETQTRRAGRACRSNDDAHAAETEEDGETQAAGGDERGGGRRGREEQTQTSQENFQHRGARVGLTQSAGSKLWRLYTGHAVAGEPAGTGGWIRGTRGRNGTTAMVSHSTMSPVAVMLRRVGGFVADVVRTANPFMSPAQKMAPSLTSKDGGVRKRTKRRRQKRRKKAVNTRAVQTKMPTDSKDWTRMWWRSPTRVSPHVRTNPRTLWETRDDRINRPG